MQTFNVRTNDGLYTYALHPLSAYEENGGQYEDGEDISTDFGLSDEPTSIETEREKYVAAISKVSDPDGPSSDFDIVHDARIAGLEPRSIWADATTGWMLISDWPAEAPLAARMVNS